MPRTQGSIVACFISCSSCSAEGCAGGAEPTPVAAWAISLPIDCFCAHSRCFFIVSLFIMPAAPASITAMKLV